MKKRVFIIHGWEGSPEANWFPWLKEELEKINYSAIVPQMPNADFPQETEWIAHMNKIIGAPDENTILVGHSLGTIAILRYLEQMDDMKKIGGIILVAAFSRTLSIPEIENFLEEPIDWENIKNKVNQITVINSDDDPYVPMEEGELIANNLGGKLITLEEAGHINAPYGHFELPVVLEEIKKMTGK